MKIVKSLVRASAAVAGGALVLGLLGGDAMAGKNPVLWPGGAQMVVGDMWSPWGPVLSVSWPIANGADHYRLTVERKVKWGTFTVVYDQSPADYTTDGVWANHRVGLGFISGTYIVTVTAYSDPDETVAYSESLHAQTTLHFR
jgi:hypothetical protein